MRCVFNLPPSYTVALHVVYVGEYDWRRMHTPKQKFITTMDIRKLVYPLLPCRCDLQWSTRGINIEEQAATIAQHRLSLAILWVSPLLPSSPSELQFWTNIHQWSFAKACGRRKWSIEERVVRSIVVTRKCHNGLQDGSANSWTGPLASSQVMELAPKVGSTFTSSWRFIDFHRFPPLFMDLHLMSMFLWMSADFHQCSWMFMNVQRCS